MNALTDIYHTVGGENWTRNGRWLQGEPCVEIWFGLACCPFTHPALVGPIDDPGLQECCARDATTGKPLCNPSNRIPIIDNKQRGFEHCHTGLETGTWADISKCVVVKMQLPQNGLNGRLPDFNIQEAATIPALSTNQSSWDDMMGDAGSGSGEVGSGALISSRRSLQAELMYWERTLHDLHDLHLEHNELSGPLPIWLNHLAHLRSLRLQGNTFEYQSPSPGWTTPLDSLLVQCTEGDVVCLGLPPGSCGAFGTHAVAVLNQRHACYTACEPTTGPPILWIAHAGAFFALILLICILTICANERARKRQGRHSISDDGSLHFRSSLCTFRRSLSSVTCASLGPIASLAGDVASTSQ